MDALEQIAGQAIRLAREGGLPLWLVVLLVIACAVAIVVLRSLPSIPHPPADLPEPTQENDGGGPPTPPAQFAENVEQNTDPSKSDTGGG